MDFDFADVKPTLFNVLLITGMAMVGIVFFKWVGNKWNLGPLSDFFNAV